VAIATRGAGRYRHRVELQAVTRTKPTDGTDPVESWTTYATVWAGLEPAPASATERAVDGAIQVPVSHLVPMRFRSDVKASHRVTFTDPRTSAVRVFAIRGIQTDPRQAWELVLSVEERVQ
jgi:head-tail adaptor